MTAWIKCSIDYFISSFSFLGHFFLPREKYQLLSFELILRKHVYYFTLALCAHVSCFGLHTCALRYTLAHSPTANVRHGLTLHGRSYVRTYFL